MSKIVALPLRSGFVTLFEGLRIVTLESGLSTSFLGPPDHFLVLFFRLIAGSSVSLFRPTTSLATGDRDPAGDTGWSPLFRSFLSVSVKKTRQGGHRTAAGQLVFTGHCRDHHLRDRRVSIAGGRSVSRIRSVFPEVRKPLHCSNLRRSRD